MTPTEVAAKLRAFNEWRRGGDIEYPGPLAVDEAIDAAVEMIERLEAAEKARDDVARQLVQSEQGKRKISEECDALRAESDARKALIDVLRAEIGGLRAKIEAAEKEREMDEARIADLMADLNRVGHENDALRIELNEIRYGVAVAHDTIKALRARIETMEKQEPYSYIYEYSNPIDGSPVWRDKPGYWNAQFPKSSKPLYLAPGAQSAPIIPEGWKLVPIEPTYEMLEAGEGTFVPTYTGTPVSAPFDVYRAMLAAAPEAKP